MNDDYLALLYDTAEEETAAASVSVFGIAITPYALCVVAALICGIAMLCLRCRKKGIGLDAALTVSLLSLPLGLICARLYYCAARFDFFDSIGLENVLHLWEGGYALWGAVAGVAAAAWIASRIHKLSFARIMDALAAPGMLVIGLCRFAEYFSGEGRGRPLDAEESAGWFIAPPVIYNPEYGMWEIAVFVMEGLAALAIMAFVLRYRGKDGDQMRLALILYAACQVVLESLRLGDVLAWSFVRVSQLVSAAVLAGLMIVAFVRKRKQNAVRTGKIILCALCFALCAGIVIVMEFLQDGKWVYLDRWICYLIMAAACAGLGAATYQAVLKD